MPTKVCLTCGNQFTKPYNASKKAWSFEYKFCSISCYWKSKQGKPPKHLKGHHHSLETRLKLSGLAKKQWAEGKGVGNFKKGAIPWNKKTTTPLKNRIRWSLEYKQWRQAVFERDNYTCQICGQRGGELNADHYPIPFYQIIDGTRWHLLWDMNNGRTLCVDCHRLTDTYGKPTQADNLIGIAA